MKKEITDKTFVVMLRGSYRVWLTEKQAEALKEQLLSGRRFVAIDRYFFKAEDIVFILPAPEIDREDRIKRGEWKCPAGYWHQRGEGCGHFNLPGAALNP
jgi:hypothetical protein